jgi:mono/diheme cytochrome c family protein
MRTLVTSLLLLLAIVLGAAVMRAELGGFSARGIPSPPERLVAKAVHRWAVPRSMKNTPNPIAFSADVWAESRAHFADHCATCHANDGSGNTEVGRSLYPKAPDMRLGDTQRLTDGEVYWIVENGVRLTGMPAWGDGTEHDVATWKLVHFIRHLRELTPMQLQEMASLNPKSPAEIREEQEDQDFLNGTTVDTTSGQTQHHHH